MDVVQKLSREFHDRPVLSKEDRIRLKFGLTHGKGKRKKKRKKKK